MTTYRLIACALVVATFLVFGWSLIRIAARSDERMANYFGEEED
jgi:hypothetical protein